MCDGPNHMEVPGEFLPHVFDDKGVENFVRQIEDMAGNSESYVLHDEDKNASKETSLIGVAGGTEWWQSLLIILASLVGVGVLSLPEAIATLGWVPGLIALMLCAFASLWSGHMYTRLVLAVPHARVLADVADAAYGKPGRIATMVLGYTYIAGVGVVYHLTASKALQQIFAGVPILECQPTSGLMFAIVMIFPLQAQSMHAVSCLSVIGTATIAVALIIVAIKLVVAGPAKDAETVLMEPFSLQHWAAGVTCCVFAFAGQAIFVELMSRQREYASFKRTVNISSISAFLVYVICASAGYAYVGREISGPLTSALPVDFWMRVTNACVFIHVAISYVIEMNVLTDAMLRLVWPSAWDYQSLDTTSPSENGDHLDSNMLLARRFPWFIMSAALIAGAYILESSIPFFSQLVSLAGALQATHIMLTLPALCALRVLPSEQLSISLRWQCYLAIPLAILAMTLGTYGAIEDIIDALMDVTQHPPWACAAPVRYARPRGGALVVFSFLVLVV